MTKRKFTRNEKKMLKVFEKHDFNVDYDEDNVILQQHTPAGEDWNIYIETPNEIIAYANNFDIDEEFTFWMKAECSGKPGATELLHDQEWKKELLTTIATEIEEIKNN